MRLTAALCATGLWVSAVSVAAQETGSHIYQGTPAEIPAGLSKEDQARVTLVSYATCLVERNRAGVRKALESPPRDFDKTAARLSVSECLRSGELRFPASLLRGPLYIALYRRDFGRTVPQLRPEPIDFAQSARLSADDPERPAFAGRFAFTDCVVRRATAAAHAVVLSPTASRSEASSMAALSPSLGPCLPGGTQFRINKLILTGLLAETLYKDADRSAGTPGKAGS